MAFDFSGVLRTVGAQHGGRMVGRDGGADQGVARLAPNALESRNCGPSRAFAAWRLMDAALAPRLPLEMLNDVGHVDPVAWNTNPS